MRLPAYPPGPLVAVLGVRVGIVPMGTLAGLPAVFLGMSGCNLWDGRPFARNEAASCCARYCDASVRGGTVFSWEEVLGRVGSVGLPPGSWLVLGGGEPTEQLLPSMVSSAHEQGWKVAVETNGTLACPALGSVDLIIWSPKPDVDSVLPRPFVGEMRVVLPGSPDPRVDWTPARLDALAQSCPLASCFVTPLDPPLDDDGSATFLRSSEGPPDALAEHAFSLALARCIRFVSSRGSRWRLGLPTDKVLPLALSSPT